MLGRSSKLQRCLMNISARVYGYFLYAYPPSLRHDYASVMQQLFCDCSRDALQRRGWAGLFSVWLDTFLDLLETIPKEWIAVFLAWWMGILTQAQFKRRKNMSETPPFVEQIAQVLTREPNYASLLVGEKPTQRMHEMIDSLALEGDPKIPQETLALFQGLGQDLPEARQARWLDRLGKAFQEILPEQVDDSETPFTELLLQLIYSNPQWYELVAASEPGYGLLDMIESLALEADVEGVEDMLSLMHTLSESYQSPA